MIGICECGCFMVEWIFVAWMSKCNVLVNGSKCSSRNSESNTTRGPGLTATKKWSTAAEWDNEYKQLIRVGRRSCKSAAEQTEARLYDVTGLALLLTIIPDNCARFSPSLNGRQTSWPALTLLRSSAINSGVYGLITILTDSYIIYRWVSPC